MSVSQLQQKEVAQTPDEAAVEGNHLVGGNLVVAEGNLSVVLIVEDNLVVEDNPAEDNLVVEVEDKTSLTNKPFLDGYVEWSLVDDQSICNVLTLKDHPAYYKRRNCLRDAGRLGFTRMTHYCEDHCPRKELHAKVVVDFDWSPKHNFIYPNVTKDRLETWMLIAKRCNIPHGVAMMVCPYIPDDRE